MLTSGIFDYRIVDIQAKYNKPINIIFTGDDHFNSHNFARSKWEQDNNDLTELAKKEPTYFIKMGDVFESMSTSERRSYVGSDFHQSTKSRWENEYAKEIKTYVKQTKYLVGRTIAVFGGNHFFTFSDGTTSDMALASMLKAPFIGCSGYIILNLKIDKHHSHILKIFCYHGKGSGKRASSSLIAPEDALSYFRDADIVAMGHDHQAAAMHVSALECSNGMGGHWKIKDVDRIICRTGSYLRSYVPQVPSYAVDKMMRPSTLGYVRISVTVKRYGYVEKKVDNRWVQLKAII